MKTLLTVSLAIFNVAFGVKIGSVSKEQEAASFFFTDSNSSAACVNEQEAASFYLLDNANLTVWEKAYESYKGNE